MSKGVKAQESKLLTLKKNLEDTDFQERIIKECEKLFASDVPPEILNEQLKNIK